MMRWLCLCCCLCCSLGAAETSYLSWDQGRPQEALPALLSEAQRSQHWAAWFDAGLCAAAAKQQGLAVAALVEASCLAPERSEIREALVSLGALPPPHWSAELGPLAAWPVHPLGALCLLLSCAALAWWLFGGARGRIPAFLAALVMLGGLPGLVAQWRDGARSYVTTVVESHLFDASGNPLRSLAPGTVMEQVGPMDQAGRAAVLLFDGSRGRLSLRDTRIQAP